MPGKAPNRLEEPRSGQDPKGLYETLQVDVTADEATIRLDSALYAHIPYV